MLSFSLFPVSAARGQTVVAVTVAEKRWRRFSLSPGPGKKSTQHWLLFALVCFVIWPGVVEAENLASVTSYETVLPEPFHEPPPMPVQEVAPVQGPLRMPAEFEKQHALVLSAGALTISYANTIAQIAQETHRSIRVIVLYSTPEARATLEIALRQRIDSLENIQLVQAPHDSRWVRDYGPTLLRDGDSFRMIDWIYGNGRAQDDQVPQYLANWSSTPCDTAAISLCGGNLLSNGLGLVLTTQATVQENIPLGISRKEVIQQLKDRTGAEKVVVLERLVGEPTGHVDMFATFTAPDTVVVGQYSPDEDAENAAILDRNAKRLASIRTLVGPLRVERIPMGRKDDGVWRTYTNCIYANSVLAVPYYRGGDPVRFQQALACYRRLLPQVRIAPINASGLIPEGGSLHCVSLNVVGLVKPRPLMPANPAGRVATVTVRGW